MNGSNLKEGTLVAFKSSALYYYPGSPEIPSWVITDYNHRVTQITSGGKPVIRGGKTCVLLGKKIDKKTGVEDSGINTWVDTDVVVTIHSGSSYETYTVKKGDTLWGIAAAKLGSGSRYPEIMKLNGLTSDKITVGLVLKIPKK